MATFKLFGGIVLIVSGLAQLVGTFWPPVGRYAEISDPRKRQQVRLGWLAQAVAFILMGITFLLGRFLTNSTLLVIALIAAVLAAVPIIFRLINPER